MVEAISYNEVIIRQGTKIKYEIMIKSKKNWKRVVPEKETIRWI